MAIEGVGYKLLVKIYVKLLKFKMPRSRYS